MAISEKLKGFLDQSKVRYTVMKHPTVYTAQEIAAAQHVPGRQLAKCVLVHTARGPVLAVLSAIHRIHFKRLKAVLGGGSVGIAKETDVKAQFPDVEAGAMSPFGNLYQVPVVVENALGASEEIVFNAGSHTETIKMRYADFASLVKPKTGAFGEPFGGTKPAKKKRARRRNPLDRSARAAKTPSAKRPAKKRARRKH